MCCNTLLQCLFNSPFHLILLISVEFQRKHKSVSKNLVGIRHPLYIDIFLYEGHVFQNGLIHSQIFHINLRYTFQSANTFQMIQEKNLLHHDVLSKKLFFRFCYYEILLIERHHLNLQYKQRRPLRCNNQNSNSPSKGAVIVRAL